MLLVLVGGVVTANAFNNSIYFNSEANNWGQGDGNTHQFTQVNENEFVTELTSSEITFLKSNNLKFKFYVGDWSCNVGSVNTNDAAVGTVKYESSNGSGNAGCLYIEKNDDVVKAQIRLKYQNSTWAITACVFENNDTYRISFDKSKDQTSANWTNVYCYAYIDDHGLVSWSENEMEGEGNVLTCSIPSIATNIIFNNGGTGNVNQSWTISEIVNKGVYKFDGVYGVTASISSVGYATFSSTKALDFLNETTIEACKASVSAGKITYTPVTTVAADEGVLLRRKDGTLAAATAIIPLNNDQTISPASDNAFKAITTRQKLAQTTDGNTNYILTIVDETLGFYKVNANGSWCAAGTAYLSVPSQLAPDFIALDGETTGIANVSRETISNNQYYTLDGRRVAQPTKGLYIVNGKKVIIK